MPASDNDEDGADDEEVTRCICGNIDLVTDESDYEDTGLFVQCDDCLVWQHGYCVGLLNDTQMPETYHCELCRPDLHRIIQRPRRRKRSTYLGLDGKDDTKPSPAAPSVRPMTADTSPPGTATGGLPTERLSSSYGSSSLSTLTKREREPSPPSVPRHRTTTAEAADEESASVRRRRNTMNSRDAAYDRQLEAALLLSAQQSGAGSGAAAPSISGRSGRSTKRRASPSGLSKRTRTPSPSPSRDSDGGSKPKRRKKGGAGEATSTITSAQLKREETQESSVSTGRRGGRKPGPAALRKASSRAKDLMQDVEEESRDDVGSIASDVPQARHRGSIVATQGSQPGSRQGSREGTPSNQTGADMAAPASRKRDRRGGGGGGKKASERAAAAAAAASMMAGSSTRSSSSGQHAATASSMVGIGGNLIGTSGRLVPLGEMRKRVSAILEYIGRCQVEMAAEKDEWVRWRHVREDDTNAAETGDIAQSVAKAERGKQATNGKLDMDEVWSYGEGNGGSVELMEKLTNTLLQWESQYGS
ncbi:hypothetical protein BCR37DRAFT_298331 [Protomyces lactucae-debilis]|uniref:Zinc finger PHD-type domain-containing protein n=1 Tax=Protomyces lactucae-debilis TaxID=2754530 RepID=A0A1Y2FGY2_PROLT|nr:uncharacterized protein BCR37DRAFT_298331 [Protomyces lactucae-debilis]ORY83192.1 hypothetical protein BCR37DRAFT_298331 [Protomyces lactucae-debilis]